MARSFFFKPNYPLCLPLRSLFILKIMHSRTLIKNAILVNEGQQSIGSLVIDGDRIEEILLGADAMPQLPPDTVIDAEGCYLLPGVIDEHVHFRDPGLTAKGDFYTESRAAAAGGVTTVIDMPNTIPPTVTKERLLQKIEIAKQQSLVNFGFFLGATPANAARLKKVDPRLVAGIKLFMGSSTGELQVEDCPTLRTIFEQSQLPIMVHCEDTPMITAKMKAYKEKYGADPHVRYHAEIRPSEACVKSTKEAIALAREFNVKLHVAHITTAAELDLFDPNDKQITAEACLPHLIFASEDYERLGARIKCNPAVKYDTDRAAIRAALTDGRIRTIGTDHAPHRISDKIGGAAKATSGMPFVQFSLVSMLDLVDEGVLPIERMVELMCHNPARVFGIENRGFLRQGYMADLVLVKPNSPWTLTPNRIESKCNWSPMEGHTFNWRVMRTFVNGCLVYNKGVITNENLRGRMITYMPR